MKNFLTTIFLLVLLFISKVTTVAAQDASPRNEAVEIFAAVLEELNQNYLEQVDTAAVCTAALHALTGSLDPYTIYFPSAGEDYYDAEDKEAIGGIGVEISEETGKKYLSRIYKNSPAHKSGFRVGDEIIAIDRVSVESKSTAEVISMLKGTPGAPTFVQVSRFASKDPIAATIIRERLEPYNVIFSKILPNGIAYIRLQQFGKNSANEAMEVMAFFKTQGATKLILDLRDNEGGVIEEVVQFLEQFLPPGSLVIRAIGRRLDFEKEYRTTNEAPDIVMPIVVLVNERSASAAEIVAGVMQDYDRAVILGQQTFGKGTIQTIVDMPYGAQLKLTTARCVLPNGRYILALGDANIPKDLKEFRTLAGRVVYEQKGIIPDVLIFQKSVSSIAADLIDYGVLRNYAAFFCSKNQDIVPIADFKLSEKQYQDFIEWLSIQKVKFTNEILLEKFLLDPGNKFSDNLKRQMRQLLLQISDANKQRLRHLKSEIKPLLESSIVEYCHMYEGSLAFALQSDPYLKEGARLLNHEAEYKKILTVL